LFAFFLGMAIMVGAELNAAVQEEWPAPATHAHRLRGWFEDKTQTLNGSSTDEQTAAAPTVPVGSKVDGATS
jgi:membrane protein